MLKLIAFDLDGTLADTLADLAAAMNHALESEGLHGYPVDDYRIFVGNGIDNLVKVTMADGWTPDGAERVKAEFYSYYADHCIDYTAAYDGAGELLDRLAADGYMTAVVSNKPDRFVPDILKTLYPDHRFTVAWGKQDGVARKPDPESLQKLLDLCKVDKSEALYIGDSNVDVIFAHNAGVKVCGVSWGFRGEAELRETGADYMVNSSEELYTLIRGIDE